MLQPKKKKQPPINNTLKTGVDFIQNTSKMIGRSRAAKNIIPMGSAFGLIDSFANNHPYQFSDMVGVVPTTATQIASLILDMTEKEKENFGDFATKKMQGKNVSKIKPKGKETNLTVKETISGPKMPDLKKKAAPVTSDASTKILRTALGLLMPDQAAQFLSAIATKDNKLGVNDLTPDIKQALFASVKNAKKRTGKASGGTQYADFGSDVDQAFQGMTAGPGKMLSIDPATQAAAMVGRVSYKTNEKGETEIYDSYDFSKTDPEKADTMYKKIRAYAGVSLPDEGNKPNLIGRIPSGQYAFGTNQDGIMKKRMNPRKRYANGSGRQGVGPTNYITNPSETLADYNIMLGKAENEALSNPWLPVTSMLGSLLQTGLGIAGSYAGAKPATTAKNGSSGLTKDVEVEGEEAFETPSGETGIFKGPSHEQGGIPMKVGKDIPAGTTVYSDRLKGADGFTMAERKARREAEESKIQKRLDSNKTDLAIKNGAKRQLAIIEKEEQQDLQLQELVSQFQDMAMAAFGTGKQGVQKMDNGGVAGPPKFPKPILAEGDYNQNIIENLHDALGIAPTTKGYGTSVGPATLKAYQNFASDYMTKQGYSGVTPDSFPHITRFYKNGKVNFPNQGEADALGLTKEGYKYDPQEPDMTGLVKADEPFVEPTGVLAGMEKIYQDGLAKEAEAKKQKRTFDPGYLPKIGDAVGLIGNYFSATQPAKVTAEQRSTDVAHTNVYENYGKAALKNLDNSETYIEGQKQAQIQKITSQSRAGKKSARNSARGVNQQRAMDWLYDTSTTQAIADAFTGANNAMMGIQDKKATVNNQRDEARGKGRWEADIADEKAKDAYYTAKGVNTATTGKFIQQTGKELNQIAMNPQVLQLMEQLGKYVKFDSNGKMVAKT